MAGASGFEFRPTVHNMHRRARKHDYSAPGFYMLTLVVAERRPLLGVLRTSPNIYIEYSALGSEIRYHEVHEVSRYYPNVEVWRQCVMPDHIHLIVRVKSQMPDGRHLGNVVGGFKSGCNNAYWRLGYPTGTGLFEEGYCDRLLFNGEQLKAWKRYLSDNPRRLAIKRANPDLFVVRHDMLIEGQWCQTVGNRFLMNIPDKMSVIVHRADSPEVYQEKKRQWLACGERGGVLVSAAVAPREKDIIREAMDRGYCVILLCDNGFPQMYKPSGEAFDTCAEGRLLQISPWEYQPQKRVITRAQCLYLNHMAELIVAGQAWY